MKGFRGSSPRVGFEKPSKRDAPPRLASDLQFAHAAGRHSPLQNGVFPENVGSVRLHERCGFEIVGRRKRLAKLNGVWRDVLMLERRSPAVD